MQCFKISFFFRFLLSFKHALNCFLTHFFLRPFDWPSHVRNLIWGFFFGQQRTRRKSKISWVHYQRMNFQIQKHKTNWPNSRSLAIIKKEDVDVVIQTKRCRVPDTCLYHDKKTTNQTNLQANLNNVLYSVLFCFLNVGFHCCISLWIHVH